MKKVNLIILIGAIGCLVITALDINRHDYVMAFLWGVNTYLLFNAIFLFIIFDKIDNLNEKNKSTKKND